MFAYLREKSLEMAAAAQSRALVRTRGRNRGLETLEWVLIAVVLVTIAYLGYVTLGGAIKDWIENDVVPILN